MSRRTRTGRRADSRRCWACAGNSRATREPIAAQFPGDKALPPLRDPGLCFRLAGSPLTPGGGMDMSRTSFVSLAVVLALCPSTTNAAWGPDNILTLGGSTHYGLSRSEERRVGKECGAGWVASI